MNKSSNMKYRNICCFSFLLAFIGIFISCSEEKANEVAESPIIEKEAQHKHKDSTEAVKEDLVITSRQFKAAGIELGTLATTGLTESIKVTGTLDVPPQSHAEVSTYIGGVIKSIRFMEASYVKRGETVMTLEHPDFIKLQEEYTSIKGNIAFLEKDFQRQKELSKENVSSGKSFQEAESKYNVEKGRLSSIKSQLSILGISTNLLDKGNITKVISLRSPINGYIAHINGSLGSYAEPNKMLFDVTDNTQINVHLDVYEKDIYKIKPGQKISINLPNQDNVQVEGKIFNIGKSMDNITKSIAVHAKITNNKHRELIPGIFVNALIHIGNTRVKAVPIEAIIRAGEKQYVFIVNDKLCAAPNVKGKDPYTVKDAKGNIVPLAYRMIEVETGTEDKNMVEIIPLKEINTYDQLVIKGAYYLMSALKSGETVGCCAPAEEEKKDK